MAPKNGMTIEEVEDALRARVYSLSERAEEDIWSFQDDFELHLTLDVVMDDLASGDSFDEVMDRVAQELVNEWIALGGLDE